MADEVRNINIKLSLNAADAIKGFKAIDKRAEESKAGFEEFGKKLDDVGATFKTQMEGLDKGFKLWETNSGKFTTALEKKRKKIELLTDKSALLEKETAGVSKELKEAAEKYGENSEAAKKLENRLLDLKIQQAEYNKELKTLNSFDWDGLDKLGDKFTKTGSFMSKAVTAPLAGIGAVGLKTNIELEDAFAGVKKTVSGSQIELEALKDTLNGLVTDKGIPISVTEMYGIAEAAGQLGIKTESISGFSEVMAKLGTATNMTSEQAATDLARLANIVQMPQDKFDELGSTIVALGNNLATTESEITSMGLRLSGAGKQINLSEADILGFAGGLSSVGIEADAGGSAFSKVMIDMQNAVMNGGEELEIFAATTGRTADEFKKAFSENAASTIIDFTEGLGKLQDEGFNTNDILDELGFSEIRVSDALRRAANSGGVFRRAIELGNKAWEENTALNEEAAQKYETAASKIDVFKNKLALAADKIGGDFKDKFSEFLEIGGKALDWFNNLDDSARKPLVFAGTIAAAIGPVLLGIGLVIKGVKKIKDTIDTLGKGIKFVMGIAPKLGKAFSFFLSPVGLAVLAIGALIAIGVLLYKNWDKVSAWLKDKFPNAFEKASEAVQNFKGFITDNLDNIESIFGGFKNFLAGLFTGDFNKMFDGLETAVGGLFGILESAIAPLESRFPNAFKFLSRVIGAFKTFASNTAENFKTILGGITNFINGVLTGDFSLALSGLGDIIKGGFGIIINIAEGAVDIIFGLFELALSPLAEKFPFAFEVITGLLNVFKDTVLSVIDNVKQIFGGIIDFITGVFTSDWTLAWQGVKDIFGGIFGTLADLLKTPLNAVISLINSTTGRINGLNIDIPDWVPGYGGKTFGLSIPQIPMLAKGTRFFEGGPAIVGERGPEIVNLNRGDAVTPADESRRMLTKLGNETRENAESERSLYRRPETVNGGYTRPLSGITNKIDVKIDKIIAGGEMTKEKTRSLKNQIKEVFKEAWEEAWFSLCIKYPNLTES